MVLLDVWEFGFYFSAGNAQKIVLWLSAIIGLFFALFLLASYLNHRKPEHFYWGISFALLWINTHISIAQGTYAYWLEPVPATFSALMVGLFAVGLWMNVKPEKEKIGKLILLYVVVMSLVIGIVKLPYVAVLNYGWSALDPIAIPIAVMALHIPSAILIIWLPLTTREENGPSALMMSIAGVLMSLVGILLALAVFEVFKGDLVCVGVTPVCVYPQEVGYLFVLFSMFPFLLLLAVIAFAWGTFVPKRWGFDIAGIELED